MNSEHVATTESEAPPPLLRLHLPTLLRSLTRRGVVFAAAAVVAAIAGVLIGIWCGTQVYETETILLYKSAVDTTTVDPDAPSLSTLLNMVKLDANLEATRKNLNLPATLSQIGSACSVTVQKGTTLMMITVRWADAAIAARIANTLRDTFLENQRGIRREKAGKELVDLSNQLDTVRKQLVNADNQINAYAVSNRIVDLGKEAQWYLEQITTLDTMCGQKRMQQKALNIQLANLDTIMSNLRVRVAQEQKESAGKMESLTENSVRIERLRELIKEDKDYRENVAVLTKAKLEMDRAAYLLSIGAVSSSAYESTVADYEQMKARTVETDQTIAWRKEVEQLDKVVVPSSGTTQSGDLLKSLMLKAFDLQLMQVSIDKEAESLEQSRDTVKAKLDKLPEFQRVYVALEREANTLSAERKRLEEALSLVRSILESEATGFSIISDAKQPRVPKESTRRKTAFSVFAMCLLLTGVLLAARELCEPHLRSAGEAAVKLNLPLLCALPAASDGASTMPGAHGPPFIEEFRECVRAMRVRMPAHCHRILVTAACFDEGVTTVAANLAASLARQDERVVIVDAQVRTAHERRIARPGLPNLPLIAAARARIERLLPHLRRATATSAKAHVNTLASLLPADAATGPGLGEYLTQAANNVVALVQPTTLNNVWILPRGGDSRTPDLLGSARMREALDTLAGAFTMVIVDAPPSGDHVDAANIAPYVDGIVFVVRADLCRASAARKATARFSLCTVPIVGVVVNGIAPFFVGI